MDGSAEPPELLRLAAIYAYVLFSVRELTAVLQPADRHEAGLHRNRPADLRPLPGMSEGEDLPLLLGGAGVGELVDVGSVGS